MVHRELGDLAVKQLDQASVPFVDKFLLLAERHSHGIKAAVDGGPSAIAEAAWSAGAFQGDEIRGLISISDLTAGGAAKVFLLVDPKWRRRGIALALIAAAKAWAIDQGMVNIFMTCSRSDWASRSLLERIDARLDLVFGEIVAQVPTHNANSETKTLSSRPQQRCSEYVRLSDH
jgi:GNAT superfamily N-acetyltransferase